MKWLAILVVGGVLLAAVGAHAALSSGTAATPDVAKLQRDVAQLKKQVTSLNVQVKDLRKRADLAASESGANFTSDGCIVGATADLFIATWKSIDVYAQQATGKLVFGPQPAFDDQSACSHLRNPTPVRQQDVPPSFSTYNDLITWIKP